MKPPPFDYSAPTSIDEVLELLHEEPEETSLLAGGQSLVPILNMRMAQPETIVDLNKVQGLEAIEARSNGRVRLGSMVRQRRLETEPLIRERVPLLSEAVGHVAHPAIRTRGTVGGSLAHADPAAELPATVSALDGVMLVRGPSGERAVAAGDFFVAPLTTAIEPAEVLVAVEVEAPPPGTGFAFIEIARTHGAFALAAVAALLHLDRSGRIDHVRVALAGVGGVPHVPAWLDETALGEPPEPALFNRIGERVGEEIEPFDDVHASARYRKRVGRVLTARALAAASARAGERGAA